MDAVLPQPMLPPRRKAIVPNGVLGMLIFVTAEIMFFAGMMSGFTIVRASNLPLNWPPPGQPRLPIESTALNTVVLLLSAAALFFAHRGFKKGGGLMPLVAAVVLGTSFVGLQGAVGFSLFNQGLTMTSSPLGSFYYLIVGSHGLHALLAMGLLALAGVRLQRGTLTASWFNTAQTFWYFLVLMWLVIYARVYFS